MPESRNLRVICIGAGITGLAVAIALRGHVSSLTILESADLVEKMNVRAAGLGLYPNAVSILRESLGIDPLKDIKAVPAKTIRIFSWQGEKEREIVPSETDWYWAHRGSLFDALLEKALSEDEEHEPAKLLLGKRVIEVDPEAGIVRTADNTTYTADLIVGAEGVRSVTRPSVVPSVISPSGISAYRWTLPDKFWVGSNFSSAAVAHFAEIFSPGAGVNTAVDDYKRGLRLIFYRCHQDGTVNGILLFPDNRLGSREQSSEDWNAAGSVNHLHEMVDDVAEPWRSLVQRGVKDCGLWQLRRQAPLSTWHRGRAIILGDAAHPMLPFQAAGAAMSLEDAEALRFALDEIGFDSDPKKLESALERTFRIRCIRCSLVQHFSNMGPFDSETMRAAARWSEERAVQKGANSSKMVPVAKEQADDPVQKFITEMVEKSSGMFDVKSTSGFVWNYKTAKDWVEKKGEYVLDKSLILE